MFVCGAITSNITRLFSTARPVTQIYVPHRLQHSGNQPTTEMNLIFLIQDSSGKLVSHSALLLESTCRDQVVCRLNNGLNQVAQTAAPQPTHTHTCVLTAEASTKGAAARGSGCITCLFKLNERLTMLIRQSTFTSTHYVSR